MQQDPNKILGELLDKLLNSAKQNTDKITKEELNKFDNDEDVKKAKDAFNKIQDILKDFTEDDKTNPKTGN